MDLLYFLKERLDFILKLYDSAVSPFEGTIRKIREGEPPYVDTRDPEYADGPAFLEEYQEADDSVMVIGHWCLCMVQASLQAYLRECIGPLGSLWWNPEALQAELSRKQGKTWFGRYRLLFLDLGIDWEEGPVLLSDLEQLNLTRDDLTHNIDMMSFNVERVQNHAKRFPRGLFTDELWQEFSVDRIKVDREKLALAIRLVSAFCAWLDEIRRTYPRYIKGLTPAEPELGPAP
jgi:hypothetical protein